MKILRKPTMEEFPRVEAMVKFNPEEQSYWDYIQEKRKMLFDESDFKSRLIFYLQELKNTRGRFNDGRVAVKRRLRFGVGHTLELLANERFTKNATPQERFMRFRKAAKWYQLADQTVGFLTDYGLRQAECHFGMAKYAQEIGAQPVTVEYLNTKGEMLISEVFGRNVEMVKDEKFVSMMKAIATKKVEGAADAYIITSKGGIQ